MDKWDCLNVGGTFDSYMFPYDNIYESMFALLHVSNNVGWADVLYITTSVRGYRPGA